MRNLKRALSLTLASVMLLGMMVVGASAAGFPDVDEEDNVEAIEVLKAVEVMVGDDNGNFDPDRNVSRTEMAVVMALLLDLDYKYYEASCPFWDVPTWAKGYVGACYANGVTVGYSATTYGAADTITPVQAASMMMRALGYFKYTEDYKDGFELVTVRQGTQIGIFDGVGSSATAPMTRNQVAKMALNALRSEMVTFTGTPGTQYTSASGETLSIGYRAEYTPRTSPEAKYNAIEGLSTTIFTDNGQYFIQLGEQLYNGELRLEDDAIDDYGRPARHWEYKGKEIGTYAKKELMREDYQLAVKGQDMYELLGSSLVTDDKYSLDVYVDGAIYTAPSGNAYSNFTKTNFTRNNKATLDHTGRGVQTEVYVDTNTKEITVAIINSYLAKALADYSETTEKVTVRVYDRINGIANKDLLLKDFPEIEGMKKDDFILVNWADDTSISRNDEKVITKVMTPEILTDSTITKFSTSDTPTTGKVTKLTTNGTQYESARQLRYDDDVLDQYDESLLTDKTYDIYLDQFGNVIGVALHSGTDNYVFITGYDLSSSNYAVTKGSANAIFLDGTMQVIDVNVKDTNTAIKNYNGKTKAANITGYNYNEWRSGLTGGDSYYTKINTWYTYTETNGVYTLRPVDADRQFATAANSGITLDHKNIRQAGSNIKVTDGSTNLTGLNGWADDKSVFITVDVDEDLAIKGQPNVIDEVTGCYTGIDNVSIDVAATFTEPAAYFLMDSKDYFIGAVVIGENNGANNNYAYIFKGAKSERFEAEASTKSTTGTYYWEIDAVIDGEWKEDVEIKTKYKSVIDTIKSKVNSNDGDALGESWASGYLFRLSFDSDGYITNAKPYDEVVGSSYIFANSSDKTGAWATKTDKESVRFMNVGTNSDPTSNGWNYQKLVSRNERTLYNATLEANGIVDNGLRTTKDTKFVVRQSEYGSDTTRVYYSLDAALAGITEADGRTNGDNSVDFNGTIAAVLDGNAQATWIVFDNNKRLDADQNATITTQDGGVTFQTANWNGFPYVNVSYTYPEWVDTNANVNVPYAVYANGREIYRTVWAITGNGSETRTTSWSGMNSTTPAYVDANAVITAKLLSDPVPASTKVRIVDQNGKELTGVMEVASSGQWKASVNLSTSAAQQLSFAYTYGDGSKTVDYTIEGTTATTAPTGTKLLDGNAPAPAGSFQSAGTGYVEIKLRLDQAGSFYTVTGSASKTLTQWNSEFGNTAAKAYTLISAIDDTTTTSKTVDGGNTTTEVNIVLGTAIAKTEGYGVKVTLNNNMSHMFVNDGDSTALTWNFTLSAINSDVDVGIKSVEKVLAPKATVTVTDNDDGKLTTGDLVTITFDKAIETYDDDEVGAKTGLTLNATYDSVNNAKYVWSTDKKTVTYQIDTAADDKDITCSADAFIDGDGLRVIKTVINLKENPLSYTVTH